MNDYPYIGELEYAGDPEECHFTNEEVLQLKRIGSTEEPITSVAIGERWTDDHELCLNVAVNGIKFSALWIIPEFYVDIVCASRGDDEGKESLIEYIYSFTKHIKMNNS